MENIGFDEVLNSLKIIKYICKDAGRMWKMSIS